MERKRTPAEIREEFERLQREREERRLQQRTNPKVSQRLRPALGTAAPSCAEHAGSDEPGPGAAGNSPSGSAAPELLFLC